jgi:hypothetical protein
VEIAEGFLGGTVMIVRNDALRAAVEDLLGRFGVEKSSVSEDVIRVGEEILQQRGHEGRVVGLRHGDLVVECSGAAARLLRWDAEQIVREIESRHPGYVNQLVVKTSRPGT